MNNIDNFNILYNKFSKKGMCKYLSLYGEEIKINCSQKKEVIISELEDKLQNNSNYYNSFIKFYLDTEEAGQKYFYFYNFIINDTILNKINNFLKNIESEENREFNLNESESWFYRKTENEILIKYIEIKKVYMHDKNLDREDENSFFKGYKKFYIPNIIFFKFFLDKNKVLIGIDKYSELDSRNDLNKKIDDILDSICGEDSHLQLEGLIDKSIIEDFLFEENVISHKIDNEINQDKKSILYAKKGDLDKILKDISSFKYSVNEVKINNSDYDIKTHPTYLAEQLRSYEDASMDIDTNIIEVYWFTHKYKNPDYFRMKINTIDSSIITYSPSITSLEMDDVIFKII